MGKASLSINQKRAVYHLNQKLQASHSVAELEKLYLLIVGSDVLANDSSCFVLVFPEQLWLIPDSVEGMHHIKEWVSSADSEVDVVIANIDYLPYRWRSIWGVLPGVEARPLILPIEELARIENQITPVPTRSLEEFL